jgi:hypothetical protein
MTEVDDESAGLGSVACKSFGNDGACRDREREESGSSRPAIADSMDLIPVAGRSLGLEEFQTWTGCCCYQTTMNLQPDGDGDWIWVIESCCLKMDGARLQGGSRRSTLQPTLAGALSVRAVR